MEELAQKIDEIIATMNSNTLPLNMLHKQTDCLLIVHN